MTRRSRLVLLAAAAYGLSLALIAAWPTNVDENFDVRDAPPGSWLIDLGVAPDQTYRLIEVAANVVLFIPFGVLLMLASLRQTWLRATVLACVISAGIELLQGLALPDREANISDVLANTIGASIGALGVAIWRWERRRATRA